MSFSMKYVVDNLHVSAYTLRFYEKEGLLRNISRDSNGRRIYNDDDLRWINFIRSLRLTGMPISKIKEYIDLYELGDETFLQRKEMMMQHKLEVQNKINENLKHLEVISYKVAMYELQERKDTQKI
ncbi:MerR family transcriptional regulator [Bacillus paralicheniformis]|uniref:MerR family transcriptional regulator n=1 Tax=Bacillus paralicheniformis TaxID=1648923 RepID=UPI00094971C8|nr:MerR family transcriptional regulator [Bacillus paralicheniformis]MDU0412329.1 MerR family transcriptional regulator [Bacillus paralicheniformis]